MCNLYGDSLQLDHYTRPSGFTYLHHSASLRSSQITSYLLLDRRVNQNLLSDCPKQYSPLHLAAEKAFNDIIELLLMGPSCDINVQSPSVGTPLHAACLAGKIKTVQILLLNGANLLLKNEKKKSAKDLAEDHPRIVYLIEKYEKRLRHNSLIVPQHEGEEGNGDDLFGLKR